MRARVHSAGRLQMLAVRAVRACRRWRVDAALCRKAVGLAALALVAVVDPAGAENVSTMFPVPAMTVPPGGTITEDMLVDRRLVANEIALRTYYTSREGLIGKVARRAIPAGTAIPYSAVREPQLFAVGERVTIEFVSGGISVRGVGVALQPGTINQPARVKNIDTGVIVDGIVRRDGVVEIGGG